MQRGNENAIYQDESGRWLFVDLGADYCAEHEMGIDRLKEEFGIDPASNKIGIARYRATEVPANLHFREFPDGSAMLICSNHTVGDVYLNGVAQDKLRFREPWQSAADIKAKKPKPHWKDDPARRFSSAWSSQDFGLRVRKEDAPGLRDLYDAMLAKNAALWIGGSGGNPFARGGLILAIADRLPKDKLDLMVVAHKDQQALAKALSQTGIEKKIKQAGLHTYGLMAQWTDGTKKAIKIFINPAEQKKHQSGWYSVEDLEAWCQGQGPVIKKP